MSVKVVAMAVRNTSGTGFVVLRNLSDGGGGVATLPVGNGSLRKYSQEVTFLPADRVYDVVADRGSALGIGVGYVGLEIDNTF